MLVGVHLKVKKMLYKATKNCSNLYLLSAMFPKLLMNLHLQLPDTFKMRSKTTDT